MESNFRIEKRASFRAVRYRLQTTNQKGEGSQAHRTSSITIRMER
ncbi:MAG: hypothetical protein Q4G60_11550 [bacterium]|nr:hypothetical protein [bacterium]